MIIINIRLNCPHCDASGTTQWYRDGDAPAYPYDLEPHFFLRMRRDDQRNTAELACSRCDRTVRWPMVATQRFSEARLAATG